MKEMFLLYLQKQKLNERGIIIGKDKAELSLLNQGLHESGILPPEVCLTEEALSRSPKGKPFLPDFPAVRFNFSHSGEYLALAISDSEVGLDIQETKNPHTDALKIAKRYFTETEYKSLLSCDTPEQRRSLFFLLWTIKEAYLKYLGCGLAGRMNSFCPDPVPPAGYPAPPHEETEYTHFSDSLFKTTKIFSNKDLYSGFILQPGTLFQNENTDKTTAEYAIFPAPAGYAMTICAEQLPDEIRFCYYPQTWDQNSYNP